MSTPTKKQLPFFEFVTLMALMMAIVALSIDSILPALPLIREDLIIAQNNHTQLIVTFLFLGLTVGQLLYGPISDSIGRKPTILIGISVFLCGCVLSIFAKDLSQMLLGRTLQGLGAASARIISIAIIRDLYAGREMARVMSFVTSIFILVPVIAPAIGQTIITFFNWHVIFGLLFMTATICCAWMQIRLPETLHPEYRRQLNIKAIMRGAKEAFFHSTTLTYTLCAGLVFGALVGYISSAQQIFQDHFDTKDLFPVYFALAALSIGIASFVNATIVKYFGMRKICHYALLVLFTLSILFIAYETIIPLPFLSFMAYIMLSFFCLGLLFGNLNAIAMEPMAHIAGIASAIIGSLSSAISLICGTIIGQLYNDTLIPLMSGFALMSLTAFILQKIENKGQT